MVTCAFFVPCSFVFRGTPLSLQVIWGLWLSAQVERHSFYGIVFIFSARINQFIFDIIPVESFLFSFVFFWMNLPEARRQQDRSVNLPLMCVARALIVFSTLTETYLFLGCDTEWLNMMQQLDCKTPLIVFDQTEQKLWIETSLWTSEESLWGREAGFNCSLLRPTLVSRAAEQTSSPGSAPLQSVT